MKNYIYIENNEGTCNVGYIIKDNKDGTFQAMIDYPFGNAECTVEPIPTKYGDDWYKEII